MSNSFGRFFRVTTFGESHGPGLGVIVDGCPAGLRLDLAEIQQELDRRKPGQSQITTSRKEADQVQILSGVMDGVTLGTSIGMIIPNEDQKSNAYDNLKDLFRPSHADYTYQARYGLRDHRGGGRASNRETAARVAAGAVAKKLLSALVGSQTLAWVQQVGSLKTKMPHGQITLAQVEANAVRCPDAEMAEAMIAAITQAKTAGDSLGGVVGFKVEGLPAGLGSPVFDKLTARLGQALFSLPATRSLGFGLGEQAVLLKGSEHNDPFILRQGKVATPENRAGGVLGGISSGETLYGHLAFKPTATLFREQTTLTQDLQPVTFQASGRHDPCVLPRAVPIVEAMINLVLADELMSFTLANLDRIKKALA